MGNCFVGFSDWCNYFFFLCFYKNKIVFNFEEDIYEQVDKMIFEDSISASNYYNEIYIENLSNSIKLSELENNC